MEEQERRRHGKTELAGFGDFGRTEIAIMGAPCGYIKEVANKLIEGLKMFNVAWADEIHSDEQQSMPQSISSGARSHLEFTNQGSEMYAASQPNKFQRASMFNNADLVLVNGNHFKADNQILIMDERKSLEKKLDRITSPMMILIDDNPEEEIPEYLEKHIKDIALVPIIKKSELERAVQLLYDLILLRVPELYGLVLTGGYSERMKENKSMIDYHGTPQWQHMYDLLDGNTTQTFLSCRQEQVQDFAGYNVLPDSFMKLGPFGGLLSAFRAYPNKAFIVLAVDLPLFGQTDLSQLMYNRNPSKIATAFLNEETGFPDPLASIWEPRSYLTLLQYLGIGYSCPRKVLINSDANVIPSPGPDTLRNANTPEEKAEIQTIINNR